jgi:hypothetical protein
VEPGGRGEGLRVGLGDAEVRGVREEVALGVGRGSSELVEAVVLLAVLSGLDGATVGSAGSLLGEGVARSAVGGDPFVAAGVGCAASGGVVGASRPAVPPAPTSLPARRSGSADGA